MEVARAGTPIEQANFDSATSSTQGRDEPRMEQLMARFSRACKGAEWPKLVPGKGNTYANFPG